MKKWKRVKKVIAPYYDKGGITIYHGDCLEILPQLEPVDCVITDPPYELGFMGKKWDSSGVAFQIEIWKEVLRVMKPGAMMFCFGGTRTHHRLTCAIEDAGFEIRDCLMWLYGSGFPKSHDISKAIDKKAGAKRIQKIIKKQDMFGGEYSIPCWTSQKQGSRSMFDGGKERPATHPATHPATFWQGQGTALKPAYEPIILAMKPLDGTFAQNALKWGVAGLNIDAGRIGISNNDNIYAKNPHTFGTIGEKGIYGKGKRTMYSVSQGRWPANVIFDEEAAEMLDEQSGTSVSRKGRPRMSTNAMFRSTPMLNTGESEYNDSGGASRFFYCAKASPSERGKENDHPTVKPRALIEHLIKLGSRSGHVLLDPFVGSGTTLVAAKELGRKAIGIEIEEKYCDIAVRRLEKTYHKPPIFSFPIFSFIDLGK